jgi:hypothetical protein
MDKHQPHSFSGKSFNFNKNECKLIDDLRKWSNKNFAERKMLTTKFISDLASVPEKFGPQEGGKCMDFDL